MMWMFILCITFFYESTTNSALESVSVCTVQYCTHKGPVGGSPRCIKNFSYHHTTIITKMITMMMIIIIIIMMDFTRSIL